MKVEPLFDKNTLSVTPATLWHKIKRRLFATTQLCIERDGSYCLSWRWKNGLVEVIDRGVMPAKGGTIMVPALTKVVCESRFALAPQGNHAN